MTRLLQTGSVSSFGSFCAGLFGKRWENVFLQKEIGTEVIFYEFG